jgi:23S rRNA pseudouridine2605 synthase
MELDERDIQALVQAANKTPAGEFDEVPRQARAPSRRPPNPADIRPAPNRTRGGRNTGGRGPRPSGVNAPAGPNPLVTNQIGGKGRGQGRKDPADRAPSGAQPDPMKTAFGYIGADSFTRQRKESNQGGPRRGGGSGGGGNGGQRRSGGRSR